MGLGITIALIVEMLPMSVDILYDVRRQSDASKTYGGAEIKTGRRVAGDFSWIIRCA